MFRDIKNKNSADREDRVRAGSACDGIPFVDEFGFEVRDGPSFVDYLGLADDLAVLDGFEVVYLNLDCGTAFFGTELGVDRGTHSGVSHSVKNASVNHIVWVLQVVRDFDDGAAVSVFHLYETQTDMFRETLWVFG